MKSVYLGFTHPILGPFLKTTYKLSNDRVSLLFMFSGACNLLAMIAYPFARIGLSRRTITTMSCLMAGISTFFYGSEIFGLHHNLYITLSSLIIGALSTTWLYTTIAVDGITLLKQDRQDSRDLLEDKYSMLWNLFGSLGLFIGPIIGGFTEFRIGFNYSCYLVGAMVLIYMMAHLLCGRSPEESKQD